MESTDISGQPFFAVQVELFDGPIDLLLHLVKKNELLIESVSLAEVTNQYLACIERMRQLDLDIAAEYLVVAATLLSIKSYVLLNEKANLEEEDGEERLPSPHEELLRRLREAEIFRASAARLAQRPILGIDVFDAPSLMGDVEAPAQEYLNHEPMLLWKALEKVLQRVGETGALYRITVDSVSIVDRMMGIINRLKSNEDGGLEFSSLINFEEGRAAVINSFLAVLELCKRRMIKVLQPELFEEIKIALIDGNFEVAEMESEFDAPATSAAVNN